jgi:putative endonuclease
MAKERQYSVYVLTNWNREVMYVGVTGDMERRLRQHQSHTFEGFTDKYNVTKLVYFEVTTDVHSALAREKEIKRWRRDKKDALVTANNPAWCDLSEDFSLRSK